MLCLFLTHHCHSIQPQNYSCQCDSVTLHTMLYLSAARIKSTPMLFPSVPMPINASPLAEQSASTRFLRFPNQIYSKAGRVHSLPRQISSWYCFSVAIRRISPHCPRNSMLFHFFSTPFHLRSFHRFAIAIRCFSQAYLFPAIPSPRGAFPLLIYAFHAQRNTFQLR